MDNRIHTTLLFAFIIFLTSAGPTFAIEADSEGPSARFNKAQALRHDGERRAALLEIDGLRRDYPHDVDYVLARAQLLAELNMDDLALAELSIGMDLDPDYMDIWILRSTILARKSGAIAKAEFDAFRRDAAARFPDAHWWQESEDLRSTWTLIAGGGYEQLSNDQPSWNRQFAELQLDKDSAFRYQFQMARDERFSGADISARLGIEHANESGWIAGLELSSASTPSFLPEFGYSGHVGKVLPNAWLIDLRYRRNEYSTTAVSSLVSTVEKYVANFRIAYSLGLSRLSGSSSLANHNLTGNWYYEEGSSVGLSVNSGREAESIGIDQVLETNVRGISLVGRQALNDRLGLHWWLGVQEQGDFYRRRFIGMALSIRI